MRLKILLVLVAVLLSIEVLADDGPLFINGATCKKDGSMNIIFGSFSTNRLYTSDIKISAEYVGHLIKKSVFDVKGEWENNYLDDDKDRVFLQTEEALFNITGEYKITADYTYNDESFKTDYTIRCPGFEFSCKLLNIKIDYCKNINNERFEAGIKLYGLGDATKENLTMDQNVFFELQTEKSYEDIYEKESSRGSFPKGTKIINPTYGQYFFNKTWDNKVRSIVAKFVNINYIAGGCVNFPNITIYDYVICEDIIEEVEEVKPIKTITSQVVKEKEVLEELEKEVNTKSVEKTNWALIILFAIFGLCVLGTIYILVNRKFNKEPGL